MKKYHNIITEIDGIKFHSRKEANYYNELKLRKRAGDIKGFTLQPVFKFPMGFKYIADFKVEYPDGHFEVVDVKGMRTTIYQLKKKCYNYFYKDAKLVEV